MKRQPSVLCSLILAFLFVSCDSTDPGDFDAEYVVESYLVAGEPLTQVRLSRTAAVEARYDVTQLGVSHADVRVNLLSADGSVEESYPFTEVDTVPGLYLPLEAARVLPLRTYMLDVDVRGDRITASTTVPGTFSLVDASADTVIYQSTEQLELSVTRSEYPTRDQSFIIFVTESLDPREEMLTPFIKAFFEENRDQITLEDLRVRGSPILNEANYDVNPDGTITIRFPWLAVVFYGPNRLRANALDDNLYDFIRSQSVQQGGSTFSPGEIPNVINRVNGALGLFGSYASVPFDLFIEQPDS